MSSDTVINVTNVSKRYHVYEKPLDRLKQSIFRGKRQFYKEFIALDRVSFEVKKGETIGIIGRNGSGKSTLLQMICGTLAPTSGEIRLNGRVAALLELGAGFNPEFTGRENVYMNASVLGLSMQEIDDIYSVIVKFADIGAFIDQPVKTYSSGMYVRLAFSVAINVNPDILIVDEALSVGDMLFKAKCMLKLKEMVDKGVTVLFVSHDTSVVRGLCQKCVFLESGKVVEFGKASDVVDLYIGRMNMDINSKLKGSYDTGLALSNDPKAYQAQEGSDNAANISGKNGVIVDIHNECEWSDAVHRYGDGGARVLDIKLLDGSHQPVSQLELDQDFIIQASIRFDNDIKEFAVGYSIRDLKGQMLVGAVSTGERVKLPSARNGEVYIVEFAGKNKVKAGVYTVSIGVELPVERNLHHIFLDVVENAVVYKSILNPDPETWFPSMVQVPVDISCYKV